MPSNKEIIDVMVNILAHFNWRWVAFLYSDNNFGTDGLELLGTPIKETDTCLAYTKGLDENTEYTQIFKQLDKQNLNTIIVFSTNLDAKALAESAIQLNVCNKVKQKAPQVGRAQKHWHCTWGGSVGVANSWF